MNTSSQTNPKTYPGVLMENDVIEDSCCPKCTKELPTNAEFCSCGFYIKASNTSSAYSFVFFLFGFLIISLLILGITGLIPGISDRFSSKLGGSEMSSVTAPSIYIENKLKTSPYSEYIRNIYQQDYKHKNILVVEINPEQWIKMNPETKKAIFDEVNSMWSNFYKGTNPPSVRFANE